MGFLKDEDQEETIQEKSSGVIILCPFEDYPQGVSYNPKIMCIIK